MSQTGREAFHEWYDKDWIAQCEETLKRTQEWALNNNLTGGETTNEPQDNSTEEAA